jgi:hypothetical protein
VPRTIRTTPHFLAEVTKAEIDHPGARDLILDFLDNRQKTFVWQGYGAKDARLKGTLGDTWHVHIIHGTVLLFYGISEASLDAYCLRDHTPLDTTPKKKAFRQTLNAYQSGAFLPFDVDAALRPPALEPPRMDPAELSALQDIIYALIACNDDRGAVEAAASGDFVELRTYVTMLAGHEVEPAGFWDAVVAGFGGTTSFQAWLTNAIAHVTSASA